MFLVRLGLGFFLACRPGRIPSVWIPARNGACGTAGGNADPPQLVAPGVSLDAGHRYHVRIPVWRTLGTIELPDRCRDYPPGRTVDRPRPDPPLPAA